MRRTAYGLLILIIAAALYFGAQHIRKTDTIDPVDFDVSGATAKPDSPPNIVIILADDLGWRDVGFNESEIPTPVMDRLAREGITLNRFYVQPTCSPTRAALMTGKSPLRLGMTSPLSKNVPTGLPLSESTLADRLGGIGYQTALVGKWHLGGRNLAYHPNERGFDHFYGHVTGGVGYYDKVHGGGYDWQRNGETVREDGYTTHLIANEASRVIRDRDPDRPLFLYAAFGAPHLPNEAPEETIASFATIEDENRRIHAAMVSELDSAIGEIHAALAEAGIENETLIWFMSDNGGLITDSPIRQLPEPLFTELIESSMGIQSNEKSIGLIRRNMNNGGSDNGPFKGGKGSVAEGGVRVPSFIYWPDQLESGVYEHMATVQDVLPTILTISGADKGAAEFDGRDLLSVLSTNTPAPTKDYLVKTAMLSQGGAIYRYPYKLLEKGGTYQLYNLETDPFEELDLAAQQPDLVAELTSAMDAFPEADPVSLPLQEMINDPDLFGGEEDREPWADRAYRSE